MTKEIKFAGRKVKADVRMLYDMKEVVYDREWLKDTENMPLYYMYRDLYKENDRKRIVEKGLRYDITVIPPKMLGREYVKTKGHFHPMAKDMTYPEIYGVLEGRAHYLLQKGRGGDVERTALVKAEKGDKVIIPPGYGHVTINPTQEKLKMANWVSRDFESIYDPIVENRGAAWFELESDFIRNSNYKRVPELEVFEASKNDPYEEDIYDLVQEPKKLEFLKSPGENKEMFEKLEFF